MIIAEDSFYTFEYENHYKILPVIHGWSYDHERIQDGIKVPKGFTYSSSNNDNWMMVEDLHR